jgi:hypothetical protein
MPEDKLSISHGDKAIEALQHALSLTKEAFDGTRECLDEIARNSTDALTLFCFLFSKDRHGIFPSRKTIREALKWSWKRLSAAMDTLEGLRRMTKTRRFKKSNMYKLWIDEKAPRSNQIEV